MTSWAPLLFLEAALKNVNNRLTDAPDNIELRFERAIILNELGRIEDAKNTYIEILKKDPTHFGALNNFGALLMAMGMPKAAIIAYREAVKCHPDNPKGHVNLADTLFKQQDSQGAMLHFKKALQLDPEYHAAHQGLAYVYAEMRDEENAKFHKQKGYKKNFTVTVPYRGQGTPLVLLMFASSVGGMIPIRHHLDDKTFYTSIIFVECYDPNIPLPPHQLIFNIIGDADLCRPDFDTALKLLEKTTAPIINHPNAVRVTGREENAARLGKIPGIITAKIITLPHEELMKETAAAMLAEKGFKFPLLLRAPGYHTGRNFIRVNTPQELASALPQLPGKEVLVIEYLDAKSDDGKIRKYRVMIIDGELYPLHAAVSSDWKVHYFTADMTDKPEHREEDKKFLENMPAVLGPKAMKALEALRDMLGLDYAGVDFSIDKNGNLLVFEANATMVVYAPDPDERWAYRRAPVQKISDAIRQMLIKRIPANQAPQLLLPAAVEILTSGGDERIKPDPVRGVNKYGCPPIPDSKILPYGSATASTISSEGFIAAEQLRNKLQQNASTYPPHEIYARELGIMRNTIINTLGLTDTEIIFANSGTDLHLYTAQLAKNNGKLLTITLEPEETGSGVPDALSGKNLKDKESLIAVATVKRRESDGSLRPLSVVDAEIERLVESAAKSNESVLLVLTDVSKTGLIFPSLELALGLRKRFPELVTLLVDACQFRLSASTIRAYLEHEFIVAITGSKFLTGPAFSGALLVPQSLSKYLRTKPLPPQMRAYSMHADWPEGWAAQKALDNKPNYGLLLRWEAALTELEAFFALPEEAITEFLKAFAQTIIQRLTDPVFEPLPVDTLDRSPIVSTQSWDQVQTIFPFMLRGPKGLLNRSAMDSVYLKLRAQACHLSQPVLCGTRDGIPVSALRLCLSMRLVVDALSPRGRGKDAIIAEALSVLDKTASIAGEF